MPTVLQQDSLLGKSLLLALRIRAHVHYIIQRGQKEIKSGAGRGAKKSGCAATDCNFPRTAWKMFLKT